MKLTDEQFDLVDKAIATVEELLLSLDVLDRSQTSTIVRLERVREQLISITSPAPMLEPRQFPTPTEPPTE